MPRQLRFSLSSAFLLLVILCCAPKSQAQLCNNQSLRGTFGYSVSGTVNKAVGPLTAGTFAAVGRIVFDGIGHVTTVRSLSNNGNVLTNDAGTGTYSVNTDCTGTFNITVGAPGNTIVLTLNTVIDDNVELRGIVTNQGTTLLLDGRKLLPILY